LGTPTTKGTLYFFGAGVLNETQSNVIISENGSFLTADTNDSLVVLYKTSGYIVPRVDVTAKMYLMAGGGSGGGSGKLSTSSMSIGATASSTVTSTTGATGSSMTVAVTTAAGFVDVIKHPTASVVYAMNSTMNAAEGTSGVYPAAIQPFTVNSNGTLTAKTKYTIGSTSTSILRGGCMDSSGYSGTNKIYFLNKTTGYLGVVSINSSTYEIASGGIGGFNPAGMVYPTMGAPGSASDPSPVSVGVCRTGRYVFIYCAGGNNSTGNAGIVVVPILTNSTWGNYEYGTKFYPINSIPSAATAYGYTASRNTGWGRIVVHPTLDRIYVACEGLNGFNYYSYNNSPTTTTNSAASAASGALTLISQWTMGTTDYSTGPRAGKSIAINAAGTALVMSASVSGSNNNGFLTFSVSSTTGNYTGPTSGDLTATTAAVTGYKDSSGAALDGYLTDGASISWDNTGTFILYPATSSTSSLGFIRHFPYDGSTNTTGFSNSSYERYALTLQAFRAVNVNGCIVFIMNAGVSSPAANATKQSYTFSPTETTVVGQDTYGGGGGAGAMSGYNGTNTYTLLANNIYQLSVGAGGAGSTGSGSNGTNSVLTNLTAGSTVYTASGGGKGGFPGSVNGSTGGCGGGGAGDAVSTATTGGTSNSSFYAGGGGSTWGAQGGGIAAAGAPGDGSFYETGVTNVGTALSSLYYHFGGGGFGGVTIHNLGFPGSQYLFGAGIGQYGIPSVFTSMSAAPNTGSGGGGSGYISSSGTGAAGGNGGSGFLLIQVTK
jgi:hypothetical protein